MLCVLAGTWESCAVVIGASGAAFGLVAALVVDFAKARERRNRSNYLPNSLPDSEA